MTRNRNRAPTDTFHQTLDNAADYILTLFPHLQTREQAKSYLLTRNGKLKGFINPNTLGFNEIKAKKNSYELSKKSLGHVMNCLFSSTNTIGVGIQRQRLLMHGYRTVDLCDEDYVNVCLLQNPAKSSFTSIVERLLRITYPSLPWHIEYFPDQQQEINLCEIDNDPKLARLFVFYIDGCNRPLSLINEYDFKITENQNATNIQLKRPPVPECFVWMMIETESGHFQSRKAWLHSKYQFIIRYGSFNINTWKEYIESNQLINSNQPTSSVGIDEEDEDRIIKVALTQFLMLHMRDENDYISDEKIGELVDQLKDKHGISRTVDEIRRMVQDTPLLASESKSPMEVQYQSPV